jgi:two-component system chemotaxis response regulator CheB
VTDEPRDPVRVLVVDDSVVVRLLLGEVIAEQQDLRLVGVAPNGAAGLDRIAALKPDVVVLDVEMPDMSGLEVLAALRQQRLRVPVVMFSTLTARGASATVEALTLGASDYVTKPSTGSREQSLATLREELVPKLLALGRRRPAGAVVRTVPVQRRSAPPSLVVIGVSTGGPNALADVVADLPADLAVPVVIVQHMPATFTTMLAARLDRCGPLPVREAQGGEVLRPGEVWLAPGGHHVRVEGDSSSSRLVLDDGPPENSCRPAVDVLFRSAAETHGGRTLAVVLTGMGKDGFAGAQLVRDAGGQVLAQDEPSSVVWGMPRFVVEGGLADAVLPLSEVAGEIAARAGARWPGLARR